MQFMSRKTYVFLSIYKYVCLLCGEYTKLTQSYKFVQPNKNMDVSFVVPKIYDSNKKREGSQIKFGMVKKDWGVVFLGSH